MNRLTWNRRASLIVIATLLTASAALGADTFTLQGKLKESGSPVDGLVDLKLTLYDGPSAGASLIAGPIFVPSVVVNEGLFVVDLDFGPGAFDGNERWIGVEVASPAGSPTFTLLSPRMPALPTPYALHAMNVSSDAVPFTFNGTNAVFTGGKVGIGTTTPTGKLHVQGSSSESVALWGDAANGVPYLHFRNETTTNDWIFRHDDTKFYIVGDGAVKVMSWQSNGNVGIGTDSPTANLMVHKAVGDPDPVMRLSTDTGIGFNTELVFDNASINGASTITPNGTLRLNDASSGTIMMALGGGDVGIGDAIPDARLAVRAAAGDPDPVLRLATDTGLGFDTELVFKNSSINGSSTITPHGPLRLNDASTGAVAMALAGGSVGVGTATPKGRLHVVGDYYGQGHMFLHAYEGDGNSGTAYVQARDDSGSSNISMQFRTQSGGAWQDVMRLHTGGNVGIGTTTPEVRLHVGGGSDVNPASGGYAVLGPTSGANLAFDNNEIMARNNGATSTLFLNNDGGNVSVCAGGGMLITPIIQITGGSDLSEQFEVAVEEDLAAEPGMVVCIDAANPGKLVVSTSAYARTVAGIISGAGGVNTGMMMGQVGTIADGAHPVALTGRVYCYVDASEHAVEPGDLLTTSSTPGHAMKATDASRAHGAIIGKAMTGLDEGERGLVLVLVSLH